MLKADIALSDLTCDIAVRNDMIVLGGSHITPYPHAALETLLVRTEGQWFVVVRECLADTEVRRGTIEKIVDAGQFDQLYRECLMWPLDYVMVEAAQAGRRLKIRCGAFGVAPLYCRAGLDRVELSWDFTDFLTQSLAIDAEILSHYLVLDTVYSARQACVGIVMLTERASLFVEPGRAHYQYPKSIEPAEPSVSQSGSDTLAAFSGLLQRVVSKRPILSSRVAVQLSGGMDSAAVAGALSTTYKPLASRGILLDGDCRKAQIERREQIAARLGLVDETVEMCELPPSLDLRPTEQRKESPQKEFYLEAFEGLWDTVRAKGSEWMFTGVGGDELFLPRNNEPQAGAEQHGRIYAEVRRLAETLLTPRALSSAHALRAFDAPAAPVPVSSLLAQACHAPHLLKRGLWPVNPLCDPAMVAFCHQLAPEHRVGRETLRRYLQSRIGDEVFPRGYVKETFVRVLPDLIARHADAIALQLQDCALADFGLVDRSAVLTLLNEVRVTRSEVTTAPLATFLWLERFARQLG